MSVHGDFAPPSGETYTIARANVPDCFLAAVPEGVARDREGNVLVDIHVASGSVVGLVPSGAGVPPLGPRLDVAGRQVWPTLLDVHTHLDKGQVIPRAVPDGTLEGGALGTIADRSRWSEDDIAARMRFGLKCAHAHGVSMIRTHLDSLEELAARSFAVFDRMRAEWAGRVELQAVGLTPLSAFRDDWGHRLADLVAETGGVLGGVTDALGVYQGAIDEEMDRLLDAFLLAAKDRGLDVDIHVDQTDGLEPFALPRIAAAVLRTKFKGRVLCGHCVSLALQPDEVARDAIAKSVDAGLDFVTLPTPMMYLQDRKPGRTPRWRGVTLARELLDAGLKVAVAGDNCRDAWFPFGDHDMIDTLNQAVRVFHLDAPFSRALAMAGPMPADIVGMSGHGRIAVGTPANFILLSARTQNEAMCRHPADRIVVRDGKRLLERPPAYAELDALEGMTG